MSAIGSGAPTAIAENPSPFVPGMRYVDMIAALTALQAVMKAIPPQK